MTVTETLQAGMQVRKRNGDAEPVDVNKIVRAVERCVQELPADFREAIVLREMEELSYQEIAQITGVPRGTVMSRLSRARARLAECLRYSVGKESFEPKEHQ